MATGGTNDCRQQIKFCTGCMQRSDERKEADKYCHDCNNSYCSACVSFHQYTSELSRHRIIDITPVTLKSRIPERLDTEIQEYREKEMDIDELVETFSRNINANTHTQRREAQSLSGSLTFEKSRFSQGDCEAPTQLSGQDCRGITNSCRTYEYVVHSQHEYDMTLPYSRGRQEMGIHAKDLNRNTIHGSLGCDESSTGNSNKETAFTNPFRESGMRTLRRNNYYKRKLILVGKSGNGKSSLGNSLMGQIKFEADKRLIAVTKYCQKAETDNLFIVDTPGFFDEGNISERALQVQQAVTNKRYCTRPHAFLLVFNSDARLTEEELYTFDLLRVIFGDESLKHTVVVFTHVSNAMTNEDFENFWKGSATMENLVAKCGNRVARIDNSRCDIHHINQILELVDDITQNGTKSFKNELMPCQIKILQQQICLYTEGQKVHEQIQILGDNLQKVMDAKEKYEKAKTAAIKLTTVLAAGAALTAYGSKKTNDNEHVSKTAETVLSKGLEMVFTNPQTVALLSSVIRDVVSKDAKTD